MNHTSLDNPVQGQILPTPGRTLAIGDCDDCPFATLVGDDCRAWACIAHLFGVGDESRLIPEVDGVHPPPDWCPLRSGPLTLEVRP